MHTNLFPGFTLSFTRLRTGVISDTLCLLFSMSMLSAVSTLPKLFGGTLDEVDGAGASIVGGGAILGWHVGVHL